MNKIQCYLLKLKNKNCQNIKRLPTLFIFRSSNAPLYLCLFIFLCYNCDETIFNIILCTLVTKYKDILNFNFSHTIYPQLCIVPFNILHNFRPVMQMKSVQDILRRADITNIGDIDQAPILFLKALETAHMKTQVSVTKLQKVFFEIILQSLI